MIKNIIKKIIGETREECYRSFTIFGKKIKLFSNKYAFRELQDENRHIEQNLIELSTAIKNLNKQINNLTSKQDDIIQFTKHIKDELQSLNNRQDKVEKQKMIDIVKQNKSLLDKIEFDNKLLFPNSFVHLSAYNKCGNAGDNILVPALRDSIVKTINHPINYCHKSVRDKMDDDVIQAINNSKGVIIGGGGLFLKDTNQNQISGWQWACPLNELDKVKVPIYMFGIGYNRFRGQEDFEPYFKENINEVIKRCKFVGLRNRGSVTAIQQYLDETLRSKVCFHPCATSVLSKIYRMPNVHNDKPFIAVNCAFDRDVLRYGDKKPEILQSIAKVLKGCSVKYDIKYYSHMKSDKEALTYFDEIGLSYSIVDLYKGLTTDEFLKIYSEPTLVLAMRGHAQLIPFGCGIPTVSIITHDKLKWFLEDIGHLEWGVDVLEEHFEERLTSTINYVLCNSEKVKEEIEFAKDMLWEITQRNIVSAFYGTEFWEGIQV